MMGDWFDNILKGELTFDLPELEVVQDGKPIFTGIGRIEWREGAPISLWAATGGADSLLGEAFRQRGEAGKLIPHSDMIHFRGTLRSGWELQTDATALDSFSVHYGSPDVIWRSELHGVTLRDLSPPSYETGPCFRLLMGWPPSDWTRRTDTERVNDFFGTVRNSTGDWMQIDISAGRVGVRAKTREWFELLFRPSENASPARAGEFILAALSSFGFILGRRLAVLAFEGRTGSEVTRWIRPCMPSPSGSSTFPPLDGIFSFSANAEHMLARAFDYFLSAPCREQVAENLHICWDSAKTPLPTRMTVAAICVESLLRTASRQTAQGPSMWDADRGVCRAWLDAQQSQLSSRFVERLKGFLRTLDHRRPIDVLRDWQARGILGVSREDVHAWSQIRNPGTHGNLVQLNADRDDLQCWIDRYSRVVNLLNRIVLHLFGYQGAYRDYSQSGWPEAIFPTADGVEL